MRPLVIVPLVNDRLGMRVRGEAVPVFRMIVTGVRVSVQTRELPDRGQEGDSHNEPEDPTHDLSLWKHRLAVNQRRSAAGRRVLI